MTNILDVINEEMNWSEVKRPNRIVDATDATIYEVHVRDVTIDPSSGVSEKNRGNFLGLTEKGTTYKNQQTILENSNIDPSYLESAMQIYLVNYNARKTRLARTYIYTPNP